MDLHLPVLCLIFSSYNTFSFGTHTDPSVQLHVCQRSYEITPTSCEYINSEWYDDELLTFIKLVSHFLFSF
jgi:hypothetical protein